MATILISKRDYERMNEALKTLEQQEFMLTVSQGLDDVKKGKTHAISKLCKALDD